MKIDDILKDNLEKIFEFIGIDPDTEIEIKDEDNYAVTISGDDLNFLIGFRGQSLDGLQNILKLMIYRETKTQPILTVDINEYKDRKAEKLQDMARNYIDKVRFFQKEVELPRMNPWERREIHMLVSEYDDILSESTGEGNNRRVVLKPKDKISEEEKE
jgi:spoIIIJ-associated protein